MAGVEIVVLSAEDVNATRVMRIPFGVLPEFTSNKAELSADAPVKLMPTFTGVWAFTPIHIIKARTAVSVCFFIVIKLIDCDYLLNTDCKKNPRNLFRSAGNIIYL